MGERSAGGVDVVGGYKLALCVVDVDVWAAVWVGVLATVEVGEHGGLVRLFFFQGSLILTTYKKCRLQIEIFSICFSLVCLRMSFSIFSYYGGKRCCFMVRIVLFLFYIRSGVIIDFKMPSNSCSLE